MINIKPNTIKYGVEIETALNHKQLDGNNGDWLNHIGEYGKPQAISGLKNWGVSNDNSIQGDITYRYTAELITLKPQTRKHIEKDLKRFQKFFSGKKKKELHEIFCFNNSTGSHIHFSICRRRFSNILMFDTIKKTRNYFFSLLRNSKLSDTAKNRIKRRYSRLYSSPIKHFNSEWKNGGRHTEFNFRSEECKKGLEWRSPNLTGITSWAEFHEAFKIYFDTLEFFINSLNKQKTKMQFSFKENLEKPIEANETLKITKDGLIIVNKDSRTFDYKFNPYMQFCNKCNHIKSECKCRKDLCSNCDYPLDECECDRCSNCDNIIEDCNCDRCNDCGRLVEDCECEGE